MATLIPLAAPPYLYYALVPVALIALIVVLTRINTTISYYSTVRTYNDSAIGGSKYVESPQLPYWLPWLGNTISFLNKTPRAYWQWIFSWHPRTTGVLTLLLGGRRTHVLFSPTAVQAMFKARSPCRDGFERDMFSQVFNMPHDQVDAAEASKHLEVDANNQYLLDFRRVNELTATFTAALDRVLAKDAAEITALSSTGLYAWIRDRMFTASVTALFGDRVLQMYPNFGEDFFQFDAEFLAFFFDLPPILMREAVARKTRMMDSLEAWNNAMYAECAKVVKEGGTDPLDPENGPAWEPLFGSRLNRARHRDYVHRRLTPRSRAGLDLGLSFGLSSNAIPATGWMLFHILHPSGEERRILPRVLEEIREAEKEDGSLDIAVLMQQPLINSIWSETLRVYTDVLVVRNLPEDITLPLDEDRRREVKFRKGDNLFAPAAIPHSDPISWPQEKEEGGIGPGGFAAERFLTVDPKTGKDVFNMGRIAGKYFPFGGGKTICPGRHFAKQEAIGAMAMILLRFDFDIKGYLSYDKKPTAEFPGVAKAFPGSGALTPGGDVVVKIRKRER